MTVYLDTSSLVKLYVAEDGSEDVHELVARASVVATSVVAFPETRAALARLNRGGHLTKSGFTTARREFDAEWPSYLALEVTASLSREAGDVAERYALRGFDALHLASFAEVARRAGAAGTRFSSFDDQLNKAARTLIGRLGRSI